MKYVYLIHSIENSYYKIGVSKNPHKRIKQLQTGNSSKLKFICSYQSKIANLIEKIIQREYSYLKKDGEWFDLSVFDEISFKEKCSKIEQSIITLNNYNNNFI